MSETKRLNRDFFARDVVKVAKDLIGKVLVFGEYKGIITETEAYAGADDPASHAFRGPTPRSSVMFGPAGHSYVYFIYGMYHCLNIVTGQEGEASAVLIRGIKLIAPTEIHLNGPGKLCRQLGITKMHNNIDMTDSESFYMEDRGLTHKFSVTPRIGIKVATDKMWRFISDDF